MKVMHTKVIIQRQIVQAIDTIKKEHPLVGSVTNAVTINFVANAQLAVGGAPAMVYLPDEGEFLGRVGDAVYINMGTLLPIHKVTLPRMARLLHDTQKPWVLDPVGIGIGALREKLLKGFKEHPPNIIRGNASEIIALARLWDVDTCATQVRLRGVDAGNPVSEAKDAAIALAKWTKGAVAVSGAVDLVTDGTLVAYSYGGSHFMEKITGSGCSLGGVVAVFLASTTPFVAALTATQIYNLAGQRAEVEAQGPVSFQGKFLDELYNAQALDIANNPFDIQEV